jgi:hypothetical protein
MKRKRMLAVQIRVEAVEGAARAARASTHPCWKGAGEGARESQDSAATSSGRSERSGFCLDSLSFTITSFPFSYRFLFISTGYQSFSFTKRTKRLTPECAPSALKPPTCFDLPCQFAPSISTPPSQLLLNTSTSHQSTQAPRLITRSCRIRIHTHAVALVSHLSPPALLPFIVIKPPLLTRPKSRRAQDR